MRGLLKIFDKTITKASRSAVEFLKDENPNFHVHNASLRAEEDHRFVFAVFYMTPDLTIKPTPYKLVAVNRHDFSAEQINPPKESEYWIRGWK